MFREQSSARKQTERAYYTKRDRINTRIRFIDNASTLKLSLDQFMLGDIGKFNQHSHLCEHKVAQLYHARRRREQQCRLGHFCCAFLHSGTQQLTKIFGRTNLVHDFRVLPTCAKVCPRHSVQRNYFGRREFQGPSNSIPNCAAA